MAHEAGRVKHPRLIIYFNRANKHVHKRLRELLTEDSNLSTWVIEAIRMRLDGVDLADQIEPRLEALERRLVDGLPTSAPPAQVPAEVELSDEFDGWD
jgi:hypothetical protein